MDHEYMQKIADILLDRSETWDKKEIALRAYHRLLSEITGIAGAIKNRDEGYETTLRSGLALSPGHAADCTLDTKRTVKYLWALDETIHAMKAEDPQRPLHIFYAGTGPFAPFAIPLTFRYGPGDIRFTAADIHRESLEALGKIVEALGIGDYFTEYVECDLTEYRHHGKYPLHILITETMHRTLSREPHVMITLNMARQLADNGRVVPESVQIEAVLSEIGKEVQYLDHKIPEEEITATRLSLGTVFEIAKNTAYDFEGHAQRIDGPIKHIDAELGNHRLLVLLTRIKLFGAIELKEKESGITHPYFVQEIGDIKKGDAIAFSFNLNQYPKMICEKVVAEEDPLAALARL